MTARVSVLIPTYNRAKFLPLAVASALEQTLPPLEVLIVDDGSTDETARVVDSLEGPIRYIHQVNRGPAAARNRGIREARGELIALLDSDDLWLPEKLELQVKILERRPVVGLVHAAAALIDAGGRATGETWGRASYDGEVCAQLLVANGINASSVVVRRELLIDAGGYDERFRALENWDLWLRLSRECMFAYIDRPLIQYRMHDGNLISNLEQQRRAYGLWLSKHVEGTERQPPLELRRRAYARFHQGFADAYVHHGALERAQLEFAKSLFYMPQQAGVAWRLLRVTMALLRQPRERRGGEAGEAARSHALAGERAGEGGLAQLVMGERAGGGGLAHVVRGERAGEVVGSRDVMGDPAGRSDRPHDDG
jgi:glycosyltransferase involved in cell wall biosynthesis